MARVLIVDDSPTELHILKVMLEKGGYQTLNATNAKEAIVLAKSERPDLILMDIVMPGTNGFQATREITKDPATAHIPVIFVTTKNQETDKVWGMRQGAKDYLIKPVQEIDLLAKVKAVMGK